MHFKYAAILTTVYTTMMYGYAIPILFPIAAFNFFNTYVMDKLLITYYFQKPPVYDDKLNTAALDMLKYSPLLMLFFGYWCMRDSSIFNNVASPLVFSNKSSIKNGNILPNVGVDLPLFICGCFILFMVLFSQLIRRCLIRNRCMNEETEIEVDEKLGTYYECLSTMDRK